ncbi:MAG TPA: AbrB/MazE/SpoVT family DNA-binding domain-containing protein [Syntrophaceae bacterium]|nr:AbrB/MazE/SpoVT family DNA-binding domain-containing protein [Syntrophaceae bacterium]
MGKKIDVAVRKTIGAGGSLLITLPKKFCKRNNLKAGDELALIFDHEMVIRPWLCEDVRNEKG